jgi:hypothetical protein
VDVSQYLFFQKHIPLDKAEQWLSRAIEIEPNNFLAKYVMANAGAAAAGRIASASACS